MVSDYAESVKDGFESAFPKSEQALDEEIASDTRDFRASLLKAKRLGVQSFFLCLNPGQNGLFAKQAREIQLAGPFFGCINMDNIQELRDSAGALNQAWYITTGIRDAFRKKYLAQFGTEDTLQGAAIHHDLVLLLNRVLTPQMSAQQMIQAIMTAPTFGDALLKAKFLKEGADQFLDINLIRANMSEMEKTP